VGSGKWQTFGIDLGPWWSMSVYLLILLSSFLQTFSCFRHKLAGDWNVNRRGAPNKIILLIVRQYYTVKRVDEVVRHPHLVTQDQFTQVSKKVSDIPVENYTINIELFRQNFQMSNFFGRNGLSEK
jgi:hypothetical protein